MFDSNYQFENSKYPHTSAYILKKLLPLLHKDKNKIILDLGCGNGYLVDILIELGYDAYGVDASTSGILLANQRHPNRFFFYDIDSLKIPNELKDKNIDTIISLEVIEHIYTPNNFMKSCDLFFSNSNKRTLLISTPYHGYFKNLVLAISGKMDNHFTVLWEGGHIKFWSKKTLTILIEKFGYAFTSFIGCGRLPFLWKSMLIICEKK